jgi:hypothetical protein
MPFNPRLITPDDAPLRPGGEIDLPDDLAALTERLGKEAAQLAASYPAVRPAVLPNPAARQPTRGRWLAFGGIGGAAAAAVVAITVQLGVFDVPQDAAPTSKKSVAADPQPLPVGPALPHTLPATTVSLTNLSGPELEAVLDLWQRDPGQATSVSF